MFCLLNSALLSAALLAPAVALAQIPASPQPLDYSRSISAPQLELLLHKPLPEQYIWAAAETEPAAPVYFRSSFHVEKPPAAATLYIAGAEQTDAIWINGKPAEVATQPDTHLKPSVYISNVSNLLRQGDNVIVIEATRHNPKASAAPPEATLLVKLVPAPPSVNAPALVISGPGWETSTNSQSGDLSHADWTPAKLLGGAESNIDFLQWNNDAGLYQWPGYDGISPFLAHTPVEPVHLLSPDGDHAALAVSAASAITIGPDQKTEQSFLYDFGRELVGRLEIVSASSAPVHLTYQYGESLGEALNSPYLGVAALIIPPNSTAYGAKSAFRYMKLVFPPSAKPVHITGVRVDGIFYPVTYRGSFDSSDAMLNRIWETGAYTAHLCMQDDIWDAPKRDRGRWMGDLDVSGNVISHVFADHFLMQDTMDRLNPPDLKEHVNGIPGYSAFWVMGEADYYRAFASHTYLNSILPSLRRLLPYMEGELDARNLFVNPHKAWLFVDWSKDLNGDTPEARRATQFEYYRAFRDGAFLLRAAGDSGAADHYEALAAAMRQASEKYLKTDDGTFGPNIQTNAMAIYSGLADAQETATIYGKILRPLTEKQMPAYDLSPYYSNYVIYAMAKAGHSDETLGFIRYYWGGMIDEGATSFWEGYDPRWDKHNFHAHLRADNGTGYFVSLAHGWSTGPTSWLMDEVLGITPATPGYSEVSIRPDLADLTYARGTLPTPQGLLEVDFSKQNAGLQAKITLPAGMRADVLLPASSGQQLEVDGKSAEAEQVENGSRLHVSLTSGEHTLIIH